MRGIAQARAEAVSGDWIDADQLRAKYWRRRGLDRQSPAASANHCDQSWPTSTARAGEPCRIVCEIHDDQRTVTVMRVQHRVDVYRC